MEMRRFSIIVALLLAVVALSWGIDQGIAQAANSNNGKFDQVLKYHGKITPAEKKAAAERFGAAQDAALAAGVALAPAALLTDPVTGYYIPDYFTTPNWANSPPLAKFVDPLPGLYISGISPTPTGEYIPVAVPDKLTYPGSDYYEIELGQYTQKMHSDPAMNPTTLRGYRQTNTTDPVVSQFHYLGPVIIATKGTPVRIKFTNTLNPNSNLFLPVDTTIMGSGPYTINYDPATKTPMAQVSGTFSQSRATLHLHGGLNPWISDGTAHQWTAPAGVTDYPKGVSVSYVPDMWFVNGNVVPNTVGQTTPPVPGATNNPGAGSLTFFWTNDQSTRFMFYHDHAYGITRLNVYAGEAAGYLINDPVLEDTLSGLGIPGTLGTAPATTDLAHLVPLVIQDKTFVDAATVMTTDPSWAWGTQPGKPVGTPVTGDLWWPHVYMPAQNPYNPDLSGINAFGRWHYGPWFFPPTPLCFASGGTDPEAVKPYCIDFPPVPNEYYLNDPNCYPVETALCLQPPERPGTHNPSWGAEAFLDTMVVNGAAYPRLDLPAAGTYRFRILNASHDRFLNLQLYRATSIVSGFTNLIGGSGYTNPVVTITPVVGDPGHGATATATVDPATGAITAITLDTVGSGYLVAPNVAITDATGTGASATATIYTALTEVGMVPAALASGFPPNWPTDGREGGVPDPATRGPAFIQIGTEGGVLPVPVALPNQPVKWNTDPTMFNVGNVLQQRDGGGTLFLAPAERADVIVDFSNFAGQTLILYNDAPTAFPALVQQYNYYTGAPDRADMGGYGPIPPGVGPNIRTVMQITVPAGGSTTAPPDDYDPIFLNNLVTAFASPTGIFASNQHQIVVGQTAYNSSYSHTFPARWPNWGLSRISDATIGFETVNPDGTFTLMSNFAMKTKAIHDEMGATFDDYGRMAAKLGLEVPFVNAANQNFILQNFVDPVTEIVNPDGIQVWKITHNGVDTHPIHFHLFDVQVVNRVGWDGFIRLPDDNELGWKDTVRISPLEDTIVALRPKQPPVPFKLPNSIRPLNPTTPIGSDMGFSQIDITDGADLVPPLLNQLINFGWEYTWHCHILSHEENDMMRAVALAVPPEAPYSLSYIIKGAKVTLSWLDNSLNETGFIVQRSINGGTWTNIATVPASTVLNGTVTFTDPTNLKNKTTYSYRVLATNVVGGPAPYPIETANSAFSNTITFAR